VSLAFPLFWLYINKGGTGHHRSFFNTVPYPSLVDQEGEDRVSPSHKTCLSSPIVG